MWLITQLLNDPAILLWGIYTGELETYIHKNSSPVISKGVLLRVDKNSKQSLGPSRVAWINRQCFIHTKSTA